MRRGRHVGGRGGSRVPSPLSELEAPPTSQGQVNSTRRDPHHTTTRRGTLAAPLDDGDEVFRPDRRHRHQARHQRGPNR